METIINFIKRQKIPVFIIGTHGETVRMRAKLYI